MEHKRLPAPEDKKLTKEHYLRLVDEHHLTFLIGKSFSLIEGRSAVSGFLTENNRADMSESLDAMFSAWQDFLDSLQHNETVRRAYELAKPQNGNDLPSDLFLTFIVNKLRESSIVLLPEYGTDAESLIHPCFDKDAERKFIVTALAYEDNPSESLAHDVKTIHNAQKNRYELVNELCNMQHNVLRGIRGTEKMDENSIIGNQENAIKSLKRY